MLLRVTLMRRLIIGLGADINCPRASRAVGQFAARLMPTSASGLPDISSCGYLHGMGKGQELPNLVGIVVAYLLTMVYSVPVRS